MGDQAALAVGVEEGDPDMDVVGQRWRVFDATMGTGAYLDGLEPAQALRTRGREEGPGKRPKYPCFGWR